MNTKVQAKDIKNQAFLTTGTAPSYAITIPRETAYADMDRVELLINFHEIGAWIVTININWLGAKTLTWVSAITADEYMEVVYDLSKDAFEQLGWGWGGWVDTTAIHKATAWEINAITEKWSPVAWDMIVIEDSADWFTKKKVDIDNLPWGGTAPVTSVNAKTWVVVLDADDIAETTDHNYMTDAQETNLDNQTNTNTGDMSDANVKTAYENNADTNAFTDAEKSNLANQSWVNTWDQDLSWLANKKVNVSRTTTTSLTPTAWANVEEDIIELATAVTINSIVGWNWDSLMIRIKDNGTQRAITWDSDYEGAMPATTTINKVLYAYFMYNSTSWKWNMLFTTSLDDTSWGWFTDLLVNIAIGDTIDLSTNLANASCVTFKPDGLEFYIWDWNNDVVARYTMSVAWDIWTATYTNEFDISAKSTLIKWIQFNATWTKMYISWSSFSIHEYDLSVAYDITTSVFLQSYSDTFTALYSISFNDDGTEMIVIANRWSWVQSNLYALSVAYDISTMTFTSALTLLWPYHFANSWSNAFIQHTNDYIRQYNLSIAYDITSFTDTWIDAWPDSAFTQWFQWYVKDDMTKLFFVGWGWTPTIKEYNNV